MALPIDKINSESEGLVIVSGLKSVKRAVLKAEALENSGVIHLHYSADKFAKYMLALNDQGLTVAKLGLILESQLDIIWNDHKSEFISLIVTHLPAYVDFCKSNEAEILAQTFGVGDVLYSPISGPTKTALAALIANIKALYP